MKLGHPGWRPGDAYAVHLGHFGDGLVDVDIGPYTSFSNPIPWGGERCPICLNFHNQEIETLACYRRHLWRRIRRDPDFAEQVRQLHGKALGCWCKPQPCHGDHLALAARWLQEHTP